MKIAGRFFKDDTDSVDSVIVISLEEGEVTIASNDGSVIICVQKEDLERVLSKIEEDK